GQPGRGEQPAHRVDMHRQAGVEAQATASRSDDASSPSSSIATVCRGLFDERGKNACSGSPKLRHTPPSGSTTTRWPRCRLSTKPERTTSASTGGSVARYGSGLALARQQRGDVGLALAVAAGDLACAGVHHSLHLVALLGDLALMLAKPDERLFQLVGGAAGERGKIRVGDEPLDEPAMLVDPRRLDHGVPAEATGGRPIVGQ